MRKNLLNIKNYILEHKFISLIVLIVIIVIVYWIIKSSSSATGPSYIIRQVKRDTIVNSVSGSGQVSAQSQVDLKTKAAGDITYLNVKVGQEVKPWTYLAQIDSGDAAYNLESAQIAYDDLVTIDPNDLQKAEDNLTDANKEIETAYDQAEISILNNSSDLADSLETLSSLLDGYLSDSKTGLSSTEKDYIKNVSEQYYLADKALKAFSKKYRTITDKSDHNTIESLISDLKSISTLTLQASKSAKETVVYLRDREDDSSTADADYATVNSLVNSVNSIVADLSSVSDDIITGSRNLKDTQTALADLQDGPDVLDLRSQELALKQKKDALADYSVVAPFAGIIASVADINVGDNVSSGTTIATLITKQKIAEISLNEIDAAKIQVGQKANLTFDAFEGLNIVGTVSEINLIGTVSQGVVSYTVKISFDTQDDRIKAGMSVSTSIITEAKIDVLTVPNSAIKSQGEIYYVEIPGATATDLPIQQTVTIGMSNDTMTEIISGLTEGDLIITKTTIGTAVQTATAKTPSISNILGGGGNRMAR